MNPSNEMSNDFYRRAAEVLGKIRSSTKSSPAQKQAAKEEFDRLDKDFVGWLHAEEAKRTAAFLEFIANMNRVIAATGDRSSAAIKQLSKLIEAATAVLNA